jgi:hypothetical protein
MRRSKRKTSSPYARAKPNKTGKNKATHHEENPLDAVPVVQPETTMPSGTSSSTSESPEVLRQPIPGIIIPEKPNIDLPIVNPLVSVTETLCIHIPHGIKLKIWNCEYVQLEKMLDNETHNQKI